MSDPGLQFRSDLTPGRRWITGLIGVAIILVFGVAVWLKPDPRGFGTHQQLGMPPCTFRALTGFNCPHCGLTTSFSWFVRGQFKKSIQANPSGVILAVASIVLLFWSAVVSIRGSFIIINEPGRFFLIGFAFWVLCSIVIWLLRLFGERL